VTLAKGLNERKLQRADTRFFKPDNDRGVRGHQAAEQFGRRVSDVVVPDLDAGERRPRLAVQNTNARYDVTIDEYVLTPLKKGEKK
jgi:hypothetical protein